MLGVETALDSILDAPWPVVLVRLLVVLERLLVDLVRLLVDRRFELAGLAVQNDFAVANTASLLVVELEPASLGENLVHISLL